MGDANELEYTVLGGGSRPQESRNKISSESIDNLNEHEINKMNKIIDDHYNEKQRTILDMKLGEIMNNTVNFLGNSYDSYTNKLIEAEFTQKMYNTDDDNLNKLQTHLIAISLFVRDDDNILYLGVIFVILSVLICFFNISRGYGNSKPDPN